MKIMISSQGKTLQSQPNLRFGRTPSFIKYDLDDNTWEAFENPAILETGGAGVAASQFLINHGVTVALSGKFGPNAHQALSSAGIRMLTFDSTYPSIEKVIEGFKKNTLSEIASPE